MPRGGKRQGAGRKRTKLSRVTGTLKKSTAEEILSKHDEQALWTEQLTAEVTVATKIGNITFPDYTARRAALIYLTDRRDGKAPQKLEVEGGKNPVKVILIGAAQ